MSKSITVNWDNARDTAIYRLIVQKTLRMSDPKNASKFEDIKDVDYEKFLELYRQKRDSEDDWMPLLGSGWEYLQLLARITSELGNDPIYGSEFLTRHMEFAKLGVIAIPMYVFKGSNVYDRENVDSIKSSANLVWGFIVPPFLSIYWDKYYTDNISKEAVNYFVLTNARYNVETFIPKVKSMLAKESLERNVLEELDANDNKYQTFLTYLTNIAEMVKVDEKMTKGYAIMFGYNNNSKSLALENAVYTTTSDIVESMRKNRLSVLGATQKDVKVVMEETNKLLKETVGVYDVDEKPMYFLLAVPFPKTKPSATMEIDYVTKSKSAIPPRSAKIVPTESQKKSQNCGLLKCDNPSPSTALGPIIMNDLPLGPSKSSQESKPKVTFKKVEMDCSLQGVKGNESLISFQGQQFGVHKQPDQDWSSYCNEVKKAISAELK